MEQILLWDQWLFTLINQWDVRLLDAFMPYYRHKLFWVPLYVFVIAGLVFNFPKRGLWIILFAILTVGTSDTVSSKWIKQSVERLRPCNEPQIQASVIARVRCGGGYSFTSSHATNHAAIASFFFFLFQGFQRWWRWLALGWAVSIGWAQVYVGVHYPLDVLVGLVLGTLIGFIWSRIYHRFYDLV